MASSIAPVSAGLGVDLLRRGDLVVHRGMESFPGRQRGELSLVLPFRSAQSAFPRRFVQPEAR